MKPKIKHYVEFLYPGILVSEKSEREIKSRDVGIRLAKGAFAHRIFDRPYTKMEGEILYGKDKNYSPWTYYGKEQTLVDVKAENNPKNKTLIGNMECNNIKRIVRTRFGQALDVGDKDKIIGERK